MSPPRLVIISGLSGSGKSTVVRALEDLGFFCVDNMPAGLLTKFLDLQTASSAEVDRFAFVMDTRERRFLQDIPGAVQAVREQGYPIEILFLECSDEALVRRFSETRRPHPAAGPEGAVLDGVRNERELLRPIKEHATLVVDTSEFTVHELRRVIVNQFSRPGEKPVLHVHVVSFGFRNGVPAEADIVMDVRFLPNPHFVPELRPRTGIDPEVAEYVLRSDATREFLLRFSGLVNFLIPFYEEEGKSNLTIAIGCTGGQHRSVAIAEEIQKQIRGGSVQIRGRHRDMER